MFHFYSTLLGLNRFVLYLWPILRILRPLRDEPRTFTLTILSSLPKRSRGYTVAKMVLFDWIQAETDLGSVHEL